MILSVDKYAVIERRHMRMDKNAWEKIKSIINQPIVAGVLVLVIWSCITNLAGLFRLPAKVSELETQVKGLTERVNAIEGNTSDKKNNSADSDSASNDDKSNLPATDASYLNAIYPSSTTEEVITNNWSRISSFEDDPITGALMCVQDPVAYDKETNEEFTVDQLTNQKVLLYYVNDGQDVFFCGQFDDKGFCTGECTTNVYENGVLVLITDAIYSKGKILSFKKVFPATTKAGVSVWAVSDRTIEGENNIGETWYYIRYDDFQQSFQSDEAVEKDIVTTESFLLNNNLILEGYYCGNSSKGRFNDDTGRACLVKYFENGTIRTLYVGKIQDGDFEDTTGNAWMIGKKDINQPDYSYYKGPFTDGKSLRDPQYWIEPVSEEWINEYLADMTFNCKLTWSIPE